MKSTVKLFLVVCLFSSAAFADGEIGNGNRNCPTGTTTCFAAPQPTNEEDAKQETTTADDSILTSVQEYLNSLVGYFVN